MTNRLRTEGTDHLLAAGRAVGAKRFVAQSYAGWPAPRTGGPVKDEDDPLDPRSAERLRAMLDAIRYLEQTVTTIDWGVGIVLRYGGFYGPGTFLSIDPEGDMVTPIRKRQFPVVGDGGGVWSFIHIADAAAATVAAIDHGAPGLYNVVDDEPARVREWLPGLAQAVRRQAAAAPAALARAADGRPGRDRHDDRGAGRLQRQGQARARWQAALPELARRLPPRVCG